MSDIQREIDYLGGMTLLAEDTQIRPAAMSHVKPSEYRFYAERALKNAAAEVARLGEEVEKGKATEISYQDMMGKCALAAGITTPLELIAKAESDQERYGDILARIIADNLATATPAQLCGIVGEVFSEMGPEIEFDSEIGYERVTKWAKPTGRLIVTPREGV